MKSKRDYARKAEDERRIVVSFSVSGVTLSQLRERLERSMSSPPTKNEIQSFARGKAYEALEEYLASPAVENDQEDVNM